MLYKIFFFLIALLPGSLFAAHVAVLETISPQGVLDVSDRQYLTDELRAQAVRALPAELNFTIMTRENIIAMLPPGKSIEQCEGSCLVETGKNISADYVAQGRVGKFGNKLTLTVEQLRRIASETAATAVSCPMTRLWSTSSSCRYFCFSLVSIFETGMPVHTLTTRAMSSSVTSWRRRLWRSSRRSSAATSFAPAASTVFAASPVFASFAV